MKSKPDSRMADALLQVWVDRRTLATALRILVNNSHHPTTTADIVRSALETFVDSSVQQGLGEYVSTTEEASRMLAIFRTNLNPSGRGLRNLKINLERDSRETEWNPKFEPDTPDGIDEMVQKALLNLDDGEVE